MGNNQHQHLLESIPHLNLTSFISEGVVRPPPCYFKNSLPLPNMPQFVIVAGLNLKAEVTTNVASDNSLSPIENQSMTSSSTRELLAGMQQTKNDLGNFENRGKQRKRAYRLSNNAIYRGEQKNKRPDGLGSIMFKDGSYFQGWFSDGFMDGKGKFTFQDGSYYQGDLTGNKATGSGTYHQMNPFFKYDGLFLNNELTGQGSYERDHDCFSGKFQNGQRVSGCLKWNVESQTVYQGGFEDGIFSGTGTLRSQMGIYNGTFAKGNKHGPGMFFYKNNYRFKGNYANNKKSGSGTVYNPEGYQVYCGELCEDAITGVGRGFIESKCVEGVWEQGRILRVHNIS